MLRSLWAVEFGARHDKRLLARWRKREKGPSDRMRVPEHKRKRPAGESRDAEVPDYRRVVLVLCPPIVDTPGPVLSSGDRIHEVVRSSPLSEESGSKPVPLPRSQGRSSDLPAHQPFSLPGSSNQFVPPVVSERRSVVTIKTPPLPQAENEALRAEVADLCKLLETSRTETSTLTSILRDERNKDLEASRRALQEVAADRLEYNRVLVQFRAIEAELPEVPLEDAITRFHLALSEVDSYREVALWQKQELSELREQVAKERKRSFEAHEELDAANVCAICLWDRLEELEESAHWYRARAHVAEELIRKYSEDEGLYEVDLPSFSSLQDKLTASEA
ncbi:hypothetical protein EV359DRAFT_68220, partial [Lentinula novae-zelandiae]